MNLISAKLVQFFGLPKKMGAALLLFGLFFTACKSSSPLAYLQAPPQEKMQIDGQSEDWPEGLQRLREKINIQYAAKEDEEFLYLYIRIDEVSYQNYVLANGAQIWIDSLGKDKKSLGLNYPLPLATSRLEELAQKAGADEAKFLALYAQELQEFELLNFVSEDIRVSNLASKDFKTAAHFDAGKRLCLEFQLPKNRLGLAPKQKTPFSLGFFVRAAKASPFEQAEQAGSLFDEQDPQNGVSSSNPILGGRSQQMNRNNSLSISPKSNLPKIWTRLSPKE